MLIRIEGVFSSYAGTYLDDTVKLAHCYAGCLTESIRFLKDHGYRVTYTSAAHDIEESKKEHDLITAPFPYPHLTDLTLWKQYVGGYLAADVLICPSFMSKRVLESYGAKNVSVIPHGVDVPETFAPLPSRFTVGYLGAVGLDKGLRYLYQAWKELAYTDATLVIGGALSNSHYVWGFWEHFGGGNIRSLGWLDKVADFYNQISCYVQPSSTEGWGCEVLEAFAHGRLVICSEGAGAADVVRPAWRFPARDVETLKRIIDGAKSMGREELECQGKFERTESEYYTWDKIRARYVQLWKELMS
jgi:glycosyltransferase involved in cell wall biosynthesis